MPTYEQRKKYNTNRFYKRLEDKKKIREANLQVEASFPRSALKKRYGFGSGNSRTDYGGRNAALNFPETPPPRETVGTLSIGRRYENGQKETAFGKVTCLNSERYAPFMDLVAKSLSLISNFPQDYLRVNLISGAATLPHTDSLRGLAPNYVMFHDPGGAITWKTFPMFRCSVVTLHGRLYIPMGYSEIKGLKLYGRPIHDGSKGAQKFLFPKEALDDLEPYGNLNCAIVGIRAGKLQYLPFNEGYKVYNSPTRLPTTQLDRILLSAEARRVPTKPRQTVRHLDKIHEWQKFEGWKYIHFFSGTNICARRTHVFFRPIREVPTGTNYHFAADNPNFANVSLNEFRTGSYLNVGKL
jgi:hypothetical protein